MPRILGRNYVDFAKHLPGSRCQIVTVANGRCNHEQRTLFQYSDPPERSYGAKRQILAKHEAQALCIDIVHRFDRRDQFA